MKVKISSAVLSISPYISTSWKNISSLQVGEKGELRIHLYEGANIEIPDLDPGVVDAIFEAHTRYADIEGPSPLKDLLQNPYSISLPMSLEGAGLLPPMAHNPEQSHLAPLPPEVLQKIATVVRAIGLEEITRMPPGEPHCNCLYCQLTRSMHGDKMEEDLTVLDEDLKFRDWDVKQTASQLYHVINPLDINEEYRVFLGDPLGCTCGHKNCEHIRAVLNT